MNITEKAKKYAEGKAMNALTSAIETAFEDGYLAGYQEGLMNQESKNGEVEYVDLNLPSKLKWSADYLRDENGYLITMTYDEACKLNIPTEAQIKELFDNCCETKIKLHAYHQILGTNGNTLFLRDAMIYTGERMDFAESYAFWVKNNDESGINRFYATSNHKGHKTTIFMGCKLPVILVK